MTTQPRPDTAVLKATFDASTQGEWEYNQFAEQLESPDKSLASFGEDDMTDADGFFAATAHNEMPSLLDYIAYLEGLCGRAANMICNMDMYDVPKSDTLVTDLRAVAPGSQQPQSTGGE